LRFRRCISGFILTLAFVHSLGAQQLAMSADQTQVVTALTAMFAAAQVDDLAKFNSLVSPGFYMFDGGKRYDGSAIMNLIKSAHAAGTRFEWNVTGPDVHITGKTAWVAYVNRGSITDAQGRTMNLTWLESAFLEKKHGAWKLVFVHSTRAPVPAQEKQSGL
jgi:ketosteroid isomerase-like protein